MDSIWTKTVNLPQFETMKGDKKTDVLIYQDIVKYRGQEAAAKYLKANEEAIETYVALAESIDCDFIRKTNYVYSTNNRKKLEEEVRALDSIGFSADFHESTKLPSLMKRVGSLTDLP